MRTSIYRTGLIFVLLAGMALACSLGEVGEQVGSAKGTAEAAIKAGEEFLATLRAFATQQAPLVATAQAFITQQAPLVETAQAFATQQGPHAAETLQAIGTQYAIGEVASDIPTIARENTTAFFASRDVVSYSTSQQYTSVVEFYKLSMPANGWSELRDEWAESSNLSVLSYHKPGRVALITISVVGNQTAVLVTIQNK